METRAFDGLSLWLYHIAVLTQCQEPFYELGSATVWCQSATHVTYLKDSLLLWFAAK